MSDHTRPCGALPWELIERYERETASRSPGTRRGVATIYNEAKDMIGRADAAMHELAGVG
jgi:hypothetical protein